MNCLDLKVIVMNLFYRGVLLGLAWFRESRLRKLYFLGSGNLVLLGLREVKI